MLMVPDMHKMTESGIALLNNSVYSILGEGGWGWWHRSIEKKTDQ